MKKRETFVYRFTQNNMALFHVLPFSLSEESAAILPVLWPGLPWGAQVCDTPHPLLGFFSCCCSLLLSPADHWLPGDHTANIQARFSSLLTILHPKFDQRLHLLPARNLGSHCFPVALWDWCHPTLPFNRASPLENLMLCTLSRSSRFYFLCNWAALDSRAVLFF